MNKTAFDEKAKIADTAVHRIKESGFVAIQELKDVLGNTKELHEVIQELQECQTVKISPNNSNLLPGLKLQSYESYKKLIGNVNFSPARQWRITLWISLIVLVLTIIPVIDIFYPLGPKEKNKDNSLNDSVTTKPIVAPVIMPTKDSTFQTSKPMISTPAKKDTLQEKKDPK